MNRIKPLFLISFPVVLLLTSCTSNEIGSSKDVNPDAIYFDYKVWGYEEEGDMTVKLQYRFGGRNGTTLLLEAPSKVEFDGTAIKVDSSKMLGAYYEISKPIKDFAGKHTIVFTDFNGKQYKEEFSFHPISFKTRLPATIKRDDLVIDLDGLAPQDYVHLMLNDTASYSEGIDRIDTIKNGRIVITKSELERLASGPIRLEISKEDEKRIKDGTAQGGKISVFYGVKREFELRDASNK